MTKSLFLLEKTTFAIQMTIKSPLNQMIIFFKVNFNALIFNTSRSLFYSFDV